MNNFVGNGTAFSDINGMLMGGGGADVLNGRLGDDTIEGGDTILDFNNVNGDNDWFEFYGLTFGGMAAGILAVNQFQKSTSDVALTANVRFFFETDTATSWYDQDGSGALAAHAMAVLNPGIDVIRNDILIV